MERHEVREIAKEALEDWLTSADPDRRAEYMHASLAAWVRLQAPQLERIGYGEACQLGRAVYTGGFAVIREFIRMYPDEIRALLTPVAREADPELVRLLAEEEEIERRTQPLPFSASTVTFTADAMYRSGGYYEGLRDGINELRQAIADRGEYWSVEHVNDTPSIYSAGPTKVRITDHIRAAHRLVQNGSWSEDIVTGNGATIELRARLS